MEAYIVKFLAENYGIVGIVMLGLGYGLVWTVKEVRILKKDKLDTADHREKHESIVSNLESHSETHRSLKNDLTILQQSTVTKKNLDDAVVELRKEFKDEVHSLKLDIQGDLSKIAENLDKRLDQAIRIAEAFISK